MLSRPNGELTRAGQYYYQLIGRPPPSRQFDRNQPLMMSMYPATQSS